MSFTSKPNYMEDQSMISIRTDRVEAEEKLIILIDEFLKLSDQTIREEDIANSVYRLFRNHGVDVGTTVFSDAAASALYFFVTDREMGDDFEKMFGDKIYFLCELLQKVIEFCNNVRFSEANLARLDKSMWEVGYTEHLSLDDILEQQNKYEFKIKHLRYHIQRKKAS